MKRNKLTICYLADASSIHTQRWVNYFANKGHGVHLLSFTPVENEKTKSVRFHLLKNKIDIKTRKISYILNILPTIFQTKKLLTNIQPDVLHAHEAVNYGRLAALTGFHPLVITPWGTDIFIKSEKLFQKPITRVTLARADLITCDGENTKQSMVERFGVNPQNIALIRFGVDTKKFIRMQKDEKLKRKLGIFDKKIVISLRGLARSHGVATLIEAIPFVVKKIPNVVFIIAGDPLYDPPYMEKIQTLVSSLNAAKAITFVGTISPDELPRYLNLADVYVSTALSDSGLSSSTAEAMACELPVVLSDSGDNKQWVQNGKGGFIVPCGDARALANRIIQILETENARKTYGTVNRAAILERNDYETEMAKMETLYYGIAD